MTIIDVMFSTRGYVRLVDVILFHQLLLEKRSLIFRVTDIVNMYETYTWLTIRSINFKTIFLVSKQWNWNENELTHKYQKYRLFSFFGDRILFLRSNFIIICVHWLYGLSLKSRCIIYVTRLTATRKLI